MKTRTVVFAGIIFCVTFCSWIVTQQTGIEKANWMLGSWANKTKKGVLIETWNKSGKLEFTGKSYMVVQKDTIVFENLRLVQENQSLFYIPVVKDQNKGLPVRFSSTLVSDSELVFENPSHDFPQMITYKRITADSLVATISGTINGMKKAQTYPMKKL